jgi:hypothetical protein
MKTSHAELIFQALRYICETLAHGDVSAVVDLGLRTDQVARLARLSLNDLRHLSEVPAHFMDVSVNTECLDRVLAHMERNRARETLHDDLIRHGAPYPMMFSFTGMSTRDFAARRRLLDLTGTGLGRPPAPTEDEEQHVWAVWQASLDQALEPRYLHVSKTTGLSLALIWSMTTAWSFTSANRAMAHDDKVVLFRRSQPTGSTDHADIDPNDGQHAGHTDQP